MDSMYIAFFLPNLDGGGAEKILTTLANEFSSRGLMVDFLLVKAGGVNLKILSADINIVDFSAPNAYLCLPKLIRYLRKRHPDVLISSLDLTNLIALIARRVAGIKTRMVIRVENMVSSQKRTPLKKIIEKLSLSLIYPWADDVIAVSKQVSDDLIVYTGISPIKVHVIYNPVLTPSLWIKAKEPIIHEWFQDGEPPVILGVGRLTQQKDFKVLINAFAVLRQKMTVRLVILGEGELRQGLENLVQKLGLEQDVSFLGYVENPYVFMQNAKVFILSSAWEGLPTVLIEALACGCPVVSTDCPGGVREILADGKYGELVQVGDYQAMAEAIARALFFDKRVVDPEWFFKFSLKQVVDQSLKLIMKC